MTETGEGAKPLDEETTLQFILLMTILMVSGRSKDDYAKSLVPAFKSFLDAADLMIVPKAERWT